MYATQFGATTLTMDDETISSTNPISFDPNASWIPEAVPQLTVDMYYRGDFIYVVSTVAGVLASDLDIAFENNVLNIKGIRRKPYNDTDVELELNECFWGGFARELTLPETANIEEIDANLTNGILTIKIPISRPKTKKIQIKVN
jgi:HSP20 family protein